AVAAERQGDGEGGDGEVGQRRRGWTRVARACRCRRGAAGERQLWETRPCGRRSGAGQHLQVGLQLVVDPDDAPGTVLQLEVAAAVVEVIAPFSGRPSRPALADLVRTLRDDP